MQPAVFERSTGRLQDRGAGLGVPTATCLALREQKIIGDEFPHLSIRSLSHVSRSDDGRPAGGCAGEVPTYLEAIRWGDMYNQLRSLVPDEQYTAGIGVQSVSDAGDSVEVTFDDGKGERFDLAIFADGYRSLGRSLISPDSELSYQGYVIWRGTLPEFSLMDPTIFEGKLHRVGFPGGHMFAYLLPGVAGGVQPGSRELNWGMFLPVAEEEVDDLFVDRSGRRRELSLPPGAMKEELQNRLKLRATELLPPFYASLVSASEDTFAQAIMTTLPTKYVKGRLCLVGDAGAIVQPFTTSGVFKGMRNAAELVGELRRSDDLSIALDRWDQRQRVTGEGLGRLGALMERHLILQTPDFSKMSQAGLTLWWSEIQHTLEQVMRT
jgi:2-polyprenyl-6-methoxyphenol hydroxylase-like FAD-dependent oxidoreductase